MDAKMTNRDIFTCIFLGFICNALAQVRQGKEHLTYMCIVTDHKIMANYMENDGPSLCYCIDRCDLEYLPAVSSNTNHMV